MGYSANLNPVPYRHVTFLLSSQNITNALEILRRLKPSRKYKYHEYITTMVDVFFLSNVITKA
ncbi:MAG TPA: hypothetical protein VFV86_10325 [Nitrososphaeraceae archaeon]|nr:hypothetical protein [Nitrososphaeraceae archaeon]